MSLKITISGLTYSVKYRPPILSDINVSIEPGQFVAILGENGAGKTTLLDIVMGFKKPTNGQVLISGKKPHKDHWKIRQKLVYLSEKVDVPGDWSARDFLKFNRFFYPNYCSKLEKELLAEFKVVEKNRFRSMSAGEIKRVQIVGALAAQPELIIVDEITAVLDIVGRRRFMTRLLERCKSSGCTILFASNILEDLEKFASKAILLKHGRLKQILDISKTSEKSPIDSFTETVATHLED